MTVFFFAGSHKEFLKNIMAFCQVWGEHIFEVKKVRFVLLFEMA